MLRKAISLLLLLGIIAPIIADDCNNPLLSVFNITALSQPTNVTGLKFCKSLQKGKSCCSADVVNSFDKKAAELSERLKSIVASRDKFLVETREKVIPGLQATLKDFKTNSEQTLQILQRQMQPLQNQQNGTRPPPLNGTQSSPLNGTQPPPLNGTQPPPLNGTQPPPLNGTQPPPLNGTQLPPLNGTQLPPLNGTQPPPTNTTQPPPTNTTQPPPTNTTQALPLNGTQPPPLNGTQPPPVNGTQPPPLNGTQPPPLNGTQPPPLNGTQPPPLNGTQPPPLNGSQSAVAPLTQNDTQERLIKNATLASAVTIVGSLEQVTKKILDDLPNLKTNFSSFQKSRSSCVVQMIKLQAAAWCLSCDPGYVTKGVSNGTIKLSNNLCNRLQNSCFDFISQSVSQSAIFSIKALAPMLQNITASFKKINQINSTNNGNVTTNDLQNNLIDPNGNDIFNAPPPEKETERPVDMPPNCTAPGQCSWICQNLFKQGKVDETIIGSGGPLSESPIPTTTSDTSATTSRLLAVDEPVVEKLLKGRTLAQEAEWEPDNDEAGIEVSFAEDPAGVSTTGAGMMKSSLLLCVAAFLGFFLL